MKIVQLGSRLRPRGWVAYADRVGERSATARDAGAELLLRLIVAGQLEKAHGASEFHGVAAITRFGKPDEIAAVLAFCASEDSGYLTGTDILVDGGTCAGQEGKKK